MKLEPETRLFEVADLVELTLKSHPDVPDDQARRVGWRLITLSFGGVDVTENDCDRLYDELHDLGVDQNAADQAVETVQIALADGRF